MPHLGGIEVLVDELSKRFAKEGHHITIISSRMAGQPVHEHISENIVVRRIATFNIMERFGVPYPLLAPTLLAVLIKEIRQADIIHLHGMLQIACVSAAILGRLFKKPIVITEHVGFVDYKNPVINAAEMFAIKTLGRICFYSADCIVTYNAAVRKFIQLLGVKAEKIVFIPNGVDTELFTVISQKEKLKLIEELDWDSNRKHVLFIARFVVKKGVDIVIQSRIPEYDFVLVPVTGDLGKYTGDQLKDFILLPPVSRAQLVKIYQACDVLVLPSHGEGFPLVVQEAMACGLPIIISNDRSYLDYVDPAYVEMIEAAPSHLLVALKKILENPEELTKRSEYSRTTAVKRYSWKNSIQNYLDIFSQAQKKKKN